MTNERFNFLLSFPKFTLAIANRREDEAEEILKQNCTVAPACHANEYAITVQATFGVDSDQADRAWELVSNFA
jgi:hypothetical protein